MKVKIKSPVQPYAMLNRSDLVIPYIKLTNRAMSSRSKLPRINTDRETHRLVGIVA